MIVNKKVTSFVHTKSTKFATRGGAEAARVAHNHKVAGSSPAPATKKNDSSSDGSFFFVGVRFKSATLEKVAGEKCRCHFARELFRVELVRRMKILGPQNVGESCPYERACPWHVAE